MRKKYLTPPTLSETRFIANDWDYDDMISGPMDNKIKAHQDLYSGLIRLHILHHASEGEVFGLWMMEELGRHGYKLSAGTMYPLLHSLEKRGFLISTEKREGKRYRRLYRITPTGRRALLAAKKKVSELFGEMFEHKLRTQHSKRKKTYFEQHRPFHALPLLFIEPLGGIFECKEICSSLAVTPLDLRLAIRDASSAISELCHDSSRELFNESGPDVYAERDELVDALYALMAFRNTVENRAA